MTLATVPDPTPPLDALLGAQPGVRRRRRALLLAAAAVVAALLALLALHLRGAGRPPLTTYRTEAVAEGPLVVKVAATGNLQPKSKVEVGSELSGLVAEVTVEENDRVTRGQVLARLDLSRLQDAVARSQAALASAGAGVQQAVATVAEARASLARYRQVSALSGGKVPSRADLDGAEAALARAEAGEASARAAVVQARADLKSDRTNLSKASIRSPVDGVVLSRAVDPGQTVASSLQAVTLFTLAEDLTRMELKVNVDEADVGQVKVGQEATFGVDAYPGRRYSGVITRLAFASTTSNNVVSYPAVIAVQNDDLSLRPGMTANAEIVTLSRARARLLPNAALRFAPPVPPGGAPGNDRSPAPGGGGILSKLLPSPPGGPPKAQAAPREGAPRIFVLRDGVPVPVEVRVGASNGQWTELLDGAVEAGAQVITESASAQP
jgi:HlyD family secretion protein